MPRVEKMFGDIVDPSVKVGTKQWYTIPLSIAVHTFVLLGVGHHSVDGLRRAADAALDDECVRGRSAATPATPTAATST